MSKNSVVTPLLLLLAAFAWVAFADHPTAKNLQTAVLDTLGLL